MMIERELNEVETQAVYKAICDAKLEPVHIDYDRKSADVFHVLNGKTYRLIYDQSCDWFCDIIYEAPYDLG